LLLLTSQVFAKELTIYDCAIKGDIETSHNNAKECNSACVKTNKTVKFKVNEDANIVKIIYYVDGTPKGQTVLKEKDQTFTNLNTFSLPTELTIFDKDNRQYGSSSSLVGIWSHRRTYLENGKSFHQIFFGEQLVELSRPPVNECGK
jgi:hypothetical protein